MTRDVLAALIECINEYFFRFVFIKAEMTPILDKPSQIPTYSGLFSINSPTQSPFFSPNLFWNRQAILFEYVSN